MTPPLLNSGRIVMNNNFFSLFLCLGNCKDCDRRATEAGKSEETIREIIIHDNPPGIQ